MTRPGLGAGPSENKSYITYKLNKNVLNGEDEVLNRLFSLLLVYVHEMQFSRLIVANLNFLICMRLFF